MTDKEKNDLFYVCALIEYIARKTKNKRGVIVDALGEKGVRKQLIDAEVNHSLSFEQVSDEIIDQYAITQGTFDTIKNCRYTISQCTDIGKPDSIMIEDCAEPGKQVEELMRVFQSFISEEISDFKTGLYYQNPSYLLE